MKMTLAVVPLPAGSLSPGKVARRLQSGNKKNGKSAGKDTR
jgi:hypothetical protein